MTDENTPGVPPSPDDRFVGSEHADRQHAENQYTADRFDDDQSTGAAPEAANATAFPDNTGKRTPNDLDAATLVGGLLALTVSVYLLFAEHDLGSLWVLPPLIVGGGIVMLVLAVLPRRN